MVLGYFDIYLERYKNIRKRSDTNGWFDKKREMKINIYVR